MVIVSNIFDLQLNKPKVAKEKKRKLHLLTYSVTIENSYYTVQLKLLYQVGS